MATELADAVFNYPAIDNHAHPLLVPNHRNAFPLEGIVSEAGGDALTRHAHTTLASYQASAQLAKLFGLRDGEPVWTALKNKRDAMDYVELCKTCFRPTGIQCILLDDGLGNGTELAEPIGWHDQFMTSPCKRIVRIETEAENILRAMPVLDEGPDSVPMSIVFIVDLLEELTDRFDTTMETHAKDDDVVGFKSVVCYRTGLDIAPSPTYEELQNAVRALLKQFKASKSLRLEQKPLNDFLIGRALRIAGLYNKPVQFHTGLGDNDIQLAKSSAAYMQPVIEAFPYTRIVLLHASYPFTREAAYLAAVYENVYLDFGEVFPCLSGDGQRAVLRQILELAPTSKILWSTDGHWWPEVYYLASVQARSALFEVLEDSLRRGTLTKHQAIEIAQNVLFHNANRLYNLSLEPNTGLLPLKV